MGKIFFNLSNRMDCQQEKSCVFLVLIARAWWIMWLIIFLLLASAAITSKCFYNGSFAALTTAHFVEVAASRGIYGIFDEEACELSSL